MPNQKERLDLFLVKKGLFPSRQRAQAAIMAGLVLVNDQKIEKAGTRIETNAQVRILGKDHSYVSRGGLKLEKAIRVFNLVLKGKIVLDVGASTGGFTDCALQHGAKKVYAVDVGCGQLAWNLRKDPRVVVLEKTNVRYLSSEQIKERPQLACIDVSFISLEKVLPVVMKILGYGGAIVALVKPQFEAGPQQVGKQGVVRSQAVQRQVLLRLIKFSLDLGLAVAGLTFSPLTGAKGNREFLLYLVAKEGGEAGGFPEERVDQVIEGAWKELE